MRISPLGLDHLVVRVADLDRSLSFYCDILGCNIDRRRDDLGLYHLRAGQAQIDLVTLDGELGRNLAHQIQMAPMWIIFVYASNPLMVPRWCIIFVATVWSPARLSIDLARKGRDLPYMSKTLTETRSN